MTITTAHGNVGDAAALKRLERFGGLKLREELTKLFLQEAPDRIASGRAALAAGDVAGIRAMAHALKSSAGQMGALRLQAACERLESHEPPQDLAGALRELDDELSRYRDWLPVAFPGSEST
jgi:HPt (histidine-containing phosphotransfer) domain-containing protein